MSLQERSFQDGGLRDRLRAEIMTASTPEAVDAVIDRFYELLEDENPFHPWAVRYRTEQQEQRAQLAALQRKEPTEESMRKDPRSAAFEQRAAEKLGVSENAWKRIRDGSAATCTYVEGVTTCALCAQGELCPHDWAPQGT